MWQMFIGETEELWSPHREMLIYIYPLLLKFLFVIWKCHSPRMLFYCLAIWFLYFDF